MSNILRIFMVLMIGCMVSESNAQNLQFSKAKLVSSTADTVPTGRVWKIESFLFSRNLCTYPNLSWGEDDKIIVNGDAFVVRAHRIDAGNIDHFFWKQDLPIWLPSGTIVKADVGVKYISIIEFKEVP